LVQITHYTSPNYMHPPKWIHTGYTVLKFFSPFRIFEELVLALKFSLWIYFLHSGFLTNLHLPWKAEFALKFSLYWMYIFYHPGFLSNLHLPWKTELRWNFSLYWIYFLLFRIFEQLCACPEKHTVPWINCIEYIYFIIQDFRATWACPEIFHCIEYVFYHSGVLTNFALALKNRVCLEFIVLNIYFLSFGIFEQLALAMKNKVCPEIFIVLNILFTFRIFRQLVPALKTEFVLKVFKLGGHPAPHTPMTVSVWNL